MNTLTRQPDHRLFLGLCALVFWAPIPLGSNRIWSSAILQVLTGLIAAGLCWLLARQRLQPSMALKKSWPAIALFFAIPLWSFLQLLPLLSPDWHSASLDPNATLFKLQKSLGYALLFTISLQLVDTRERLRLLAMVILASGLFEASYAVLTVLGGSDFDILRIRPPGQYQGDAAGTFVNRNHFAGYIEMCLAVGVGLLIASFKESRGDTTWRERSRELLRALLGEKTRLRLFLVALVIALVMSHSRMGNSAFFASMGITAGIGYLLYRQTSQSMVMLFGSMILIDVFIISAWFGLDKLAARIQQTQMNNEVRLNINADAWVWFQEHWLTGSGAGSFISMFPRYRSHDVVGFFNFAHNDYLQILGEYGVIGGSLFAAIAACTLLTAVQAQRTRSNALLRGMGFAAMMGLISLLIHSSVDFNLHIPANAALLTLLCAFAFIARYLKQPSKKPGTRKSRLRRSSGMAAH
ncbi:MAG: O-antigen ligase family protein [bacterium]|nr:O-antigen ligase family protein [bacterium]